MKRLSVTLLFVLISFPGNILFAQDGADCAPYEGYRPDYQVFVATSPGKKGKKMPPWRAMRFANEITKIQDMIDRQESYELINKSFEEVLGNKNYEPYNYNIAVMIYGDILSSFIADNKLYNQEQVAYYVDFIIKEEGLYADYIVKSLPFLQGYWSASRIDSVASAVYDTVSDMLIQYEQGTYPPALREKYANSGKYERDWACLAILYRPVLDDLLVFMD